MSGPVASLSMFVFVCFTITAMFVFVCLTVTTMFVFVCFTITAMFVCLFDSHIYAFVCFTITISWQTCSLVWASAKSNDLSIYITLTVPSRPVMVPGLTRFKHRFSKPPTPNPEKPLLLDRKAPTPNNLKPLLLDQKAPTPINFSKTPRPLTLILNGIALTSTSCPDTMLLSEW